MPPVLRLRDLAVRYGAVKAVQSLSLEVSQGEIVVLLGPNGAGKTTTLMTISGLLSPVAGSIEFEGNSIVGRPPHDIVNLGLLHVPEGRAILAKMTTFENLVMGSYCTGAIDNRLLSTCFELFPRLKERRDQMAGTLSGGEQQMLAIGRALMGRPKLLMMDEPSLGLSPMLVKEMFTKIVKLREDGVTIFLVEQNTRQALKIADRGYIMASGRIVAQDTAKALLASEDAIKAYLGARPAGESKA